MNIATPSSSLAAARAAATGAATATGPAAAARPRMAYIDNLRWTVIAMVVLVHACVTYSGIGSWFYKEPAAQDIAARIVFALYETFSQAFFMGILFFVAAVFTPGSYDRKGFGKFVGERLLRLGVPTLVFMLILGPLTGLVRDAGTGRFVSWADSLLRYRQYLASGSFIGESGPLWFTLALLVFSILYATVRLASGLARGSRVPAVRAELALTPKAVHLAAVLLIVIIAAGSFLVRLVQPIGTSWFNLQLCFFPQYVVLFAAGLWAGRRGFLRAVPRAAGMTWLKLAFVVGVPAWFLLMGLGGVMSPGGEEVITGGMRWQAAGYAAWESFFAVSVSIGLLTLYREKANVRNRGTGLLADGCFGIYVFHAPILVAASMMLKSVALYPLAKAALAAMAVFAVSLAVAWAVRRIPGVRKVFA
jgi:glucans biosynthesis protein C